MKFKSSLIFGVFIVIFTTFIQVKANTTGSAVTLTVSEIDAAIQSATTHGKIIDISSSGFSISRAIASVASLPVIFRSKIDGWDYDIVVFEMNFDKNQAFLKMASKFSVPGAQNNQAIYFASDRIAFSSQNGFKGELNILQSTLSSARNAEISAETNALLNGKSTFYEISLPGFGNNLIMGLDEDTNMTFSCGAFEKFELSGYVKSFNTVNQENGEGEPINDGLPFMLAFNSVSVNDWQDIYFQARAANSFHSASFSDLGFRFENTSNILVDLSKRQNPSGLPKCANLAGANWKGIYFESFEIRLPKFFKLKSGASLPTYKGKNLFIDPSGLIGNMVAENVFGLEEGITNGQNPMDMSLEKITVDYSCGGKINGLFIGQIGFDLCDNSGGKFKNDYVFSYTNNAGYLYSLKETNSSRLKATNTITFSNGSSLSLNINNGNLDVLERYYNSPLVTSDLFNNSICKNFSGNLTVANCPDFIEWSTGGSTASIEITPTETQSYRVNCFDKYCINAISEPIEIAVYERLEAPLLSSDKTEEPYCATLEANITNDQNCPGIIEWQIDNADWRALASNETSYKLHEPSITQNTTHSYSTRCRLNTCISEPSNVITLNLLKSPPKPRVESTPGDYIVCQTKWLGAENCTNGNYRWFKDDVLLADHGYQKVISQEGSYKYNVKCVDETTGCESAFFGDIYFKIERCHCAPGIPSYDDARPSNSTVAQSISVYMHCEAGSTVEWYDYDKKLISSGNSYTINDDRNNRNNYIGLHTRCRNSSNCYSPYKLDWFMISSPAPPAMPVFDNALPGLEVTNTSISVYMSCEAGTTLHWYDYNKNEIGSGVSYTIANNAENRNNYIGLYTRCRNSEGDHSEYKLNWFKINSPNPPAIPVFDNALPGTEVTNTSINIYMSCEAGATLHWYDYWKNEIGSGATYTLQNSEGNRDKSIGIYTRCQKDGEYSDFKLDWFKINSNGVPNNTPNWIGQGTYKCRENVSYEEEKDTNPSSPSYNTYRWVKEGGTACVNCSSPAAPTVASSSTTAPATLTASGCAGTVQWSDGKSGSSISVVAGTYSATCKIGDCVSGSSGQIVITENTIINPCTANWVNQNADVCINNVSFITEKDTNSCSGSFNRTRTTSRGGNGCILQALEAPQINFSLGYLAFGSCKYGTFTWVNPINYDASKAIRSKMPSYFEAKCSYPNHPVALPQSTKIYVPNNPAISLSPTTTWNSILNISCQNSSIIMNGQNLNSPTFNKNIFDGSFCQNETYNFECRTPEGLMSQEVSQRIYPNMNSPRIRIGNIYTNNNCISINVTERSLSTDEGKLEQGISLYNDKKHPSCDNIFASLSGVYKIKTNTNDKYIVNLSNGIINSIRECR
jgi:hypothetical protein